MVGEERFQTALSKSLVKDLDLTLFEKTGEKSTKQLLSSEKMRHSDCNEDCKKNFFRDFRKGFFYLNTVKNLKSIQHFVCKYKKLSADTYDIIIIIRSKWQSRV